MLRKILIVDADDQVTSVLELKLRQQGYNVKSLSRTVNAIKVVKEFAPDLIISEMELPELSGVDFLKRVKMNPDTMTIPFIFLSSSRNVEDKILAHEMGAEAFFMKPIFIKVLIHRISDFFDQEKFNELLSSSKDLKEFKGDLSSISVIDILNIIAENKSTGVVDLASSNDMKSKMFFTSGAVTRVESEDGDNKNGMDELYNVLSWLDGAFSISYKENNVHRNIRVPHDRLLVKAANWLDDYTSELSDMPPLDSMLYFNPGRFLKEINKFPDNISIIIRGIGPEGSRFSDIIERTDLDRKQTVNSLKEMLELKVVSIEKVESAYKLPKEPQWLSGKEESDIEMESLLDDFGSLDTSDDKEVESPMETLVPPPTLAKKDTIDPVEGLSFDVSESFEKPQAAGVSAPSLLNSEELKTEEELEEQKEEAAEENVVKAIEEDFEVDIEEPVDIVDIDQDDEEDMKTEIINTVSDEEELKSLMDEHIEDVETEKALLKDQYPKKSGSFLVVAMFTILLVVIAAGAGAYYYKNVLRHMFFDVKTTPQKVIVKKTVVKTVTEQEKLLELSVAQLNDKAAKLYANESYDAAVKVNEIALEKLKKDEVKDGPIYKKVIMNMAIYLYMQEDNVKALSFAEESIKLREDAKSIELKVAILEALEKNIDAASFLREKILEPKYTPKKKEWMREINRLEKIKR